MRYDHACLLMLFYSIACVLHCLLLECSIACCLCVLGASTYFSIALIGQVVCDVRWECSRVYNSWEACNQQVSWYSDNSHRGFKTRQAAEEAYSKFVREHACMKVEVDKVDHQFGLKNFIIFVQFIAIAVMWC